MTSYSHDKAEPPDSQASALRMAPTVPSRTGSGEQRTEEEDAKDRQGLVEPLKHISMGTDRLGKVGIL